MATTADVVEVRLQADTARYVQNIAAADKAFTQATGRIEKNAARISAAGTSAQSSFSGIAAQFQDIGVTAAMGMNPMMIALQQGTQLAAQLQVTASKGQGVFRALATGVAGLINPISIATIATIGLGTAAAQYFASLINDGAVSEEVLKRQRTAVEDLVERWGSLVPGLQAVADKLEEVDQKARIEDAYDLAKGLNLEDAKKQLDEAGVALSEMVGRLLEVNQYGSDVDDVVQVFLKLRGEVDDGKISVDTLTAAQAALANMTSGQNVPAVQRFVGVLTTFLAVAANAANAVNRLKNEQADLSGGVIANNALSDYVATQAELNAMTADQLALYNEVNRVKAEMGRAGVTELPTEAELSRLAKERLDAERRRREERVAATAAGKADLKATRDADREAQAVLDLIAQLEHEREVVGMSNTERAVANALREAGAAATDLQKEKIRELIHVTYEEQEAMRELDRVSQAWASTMQSALERFIFDMIEGKSAAEALGSVLQDIGRQLIKAGIGSLIGSIDFDGFRAAGGPVSSGKSYIVGENGPELFTPSGAGNITPNHAMSGGGGGFTYAPVIDARGADSGAVARLERVLERQRQELPAMVINTMRQARRSNVRV